MGVLGVFALIVIAIMISLVIWLVVLLGTLPGNIARKRGHPQADAITALGWIGVITLGVGWFIGIVWAYTIPAGAGSSDLALNNRIKALESQLEQLRAGEGAS